MTKAYGVEDAENRIAWPAVFVVGRDRRVAWRSVSETYAKRPAIDAILGRLDAAR